MGIFEISSDDELGLVETLKLEEVVSRALDELTSSVVINGPHSVENHTNYEIVGLAETPEQIDNLCWSLLGFVGDVFTIDFNLDNAIGYADQAVKNLLEILKYSLGYSKTLTNQQKELNRDPLIHELIAHTLILIHQRNQIILEWLGEVIACRPPHLNANDSGLDLVAISRERGNIYPVVGEMKAYETNPSRGFSIACEKFSEVRTGIHNAELRRALKDMGSNLGITPQQLADNFWMNESKFGAVIGHENRDDINLSPDYCSTAKTVVDQPSEKLFLICSPFSSMRELFDHIVNRMALLASSLGGE